MKLRYVIQVNKSTFTIKDDINSINISYTGSNKRFLGYAWKCIFSCVKWFVSIILNFCALCVAHIQFKDNKQGYPKIIEYIHSIKNNCWMSLFHNFKPSLKVFMSLIPLFLNWLFLYEEMHLYRILYIGMTTQMLH